MNVYKRISLRQITAILFAALTILAYAQSSDTHVVKRGETFASIAAKYGMKENELKQANPSVKTCYAGMKLTVRSKTATQAAMPSAAQNPRPASVKSATIPEPDRLAPLKASVNTALNYCERGKWSKAISIIKNVEKDAYCTGEFRKLCDEILAFAKERRSEERAAFWENLAEGLERAGDALQQASIRMQGGSVASFPTAPTFPQTGSVGTTAVGTTASTTSVNTNRVPSYNVKEPENLDAQHLQELRQKGKTDVEMTSGNPKTVRHVALCFICKGKPQNHSCDHCSGTGKDPFNSLINGVRSYNLNESCNRCGGTGKACWTCNNKGYTDQIWTLAGEQLIAIDGKPVKTDYGDSNSNNSNSVGGSSSSTAYPENSNSQKTECVSCHGSKKCWRCGGHGRWLSDDGKREKPCEYCHQSGKCNDCFGRGWRYR